MSRLLLVGFGFGAAAASAGTVTPCPPPGHVEVPIVIQTLDQSGDGRYACGTRGCFVAAPRPQTEQFTVRFDDGTIGELVATPTGCRWGRWSVLPAARWSQTTANLQNRPVARPALVNRCTEHDEADRPRFAARRGPIAGLLLGPLGLAAALVAALAGVVAGGARLLSTAAWLLPVPIRPIRAASRPAFVPDHALPTLRGSGALRRARARAARLVVVDAGAVQRRLSAIRDASSSGGPA